MFLAKLKLAMGAVMLVAALGAGGVAYQVSGPRPAQAAPETKPVSELEALKKENDLLKLNLQVVLEKVRAQEAELKALKGQAKAVRDHLDLGVAVLDFDSDGSIDLFVTNQAPNPLQQVEAALKAFREAKDPDTRRRAAASLEQAVKRLKEQPKRPQGGK
jgi:hypothetical protein